MDQSKTQAPSPAELIVTIFNRLKTHPENNNIVLSSIEELNNLFTKENDQRERENLLIVVDQQNGIELIEALQNHPDNEIYKAILRFINDFASAEKYS